MYDTTQCYRDQCVGGGRCWYLLALVRLAWNQPPPSDSGPPAAELGLCPWQIREPGPARWLHGERSEPAQGPPTSTAGRRRNTSSQSVNVCRLHDTCRETFAPRESNKEMASNIDLLVLRCCVDVTDSSTVTTRAESLMMTFCLCISTGSVPCCLFPPQYNTHMNGGLNEKLNIMVWNTVLLMCCVWLKDERQILKLLLPPCSEILSAVTWNIFRDVTGETECGCHQRNKSQDFDVSCDFVSPQLSLWHSSCQSRQVVTSDV